MTVGRDRIGVRELRNQVARALRRARAGERIVITIDGDPVAQLGPLEPAGRPALDDLLATGLVIAATQPRPVDPEPLTRPVDVRLDQVLEELRGG